MIYDARTGAVEVLAGQGAAPPWPPGRPSRPAAASRQGPRTGGRSAVLDACLTGSNRHGTVTFAQSARRLRLLDRHDKPWHADLARTVRRLIEAEKGSAGDRRRGLRLTADYFYRGPLAREIGDWSRANGGFLRYGDLARHVTRVEEPAAISIAGTRWTNAAPGRKGPACSPPSRCSRDSTWPPCARAGRTRSTSPSRR